MGGIYFHSRKSIVNDLLKFISQAHIVISKTSTLHEAINALISYHKIPEHYHKKLYNSSVYLKRRGYVRFQPFLKPTPAGKHRLTLLELLDLQLPKPKIWDGKWRMVIFDIPIEKNKYRLAFQEKIKNLGFIMIQKSVWVYPYECEKEIDQLRTFYKIRYYVTYVLILKIEDEEELRSRFNM